MFDTILDKCGLRCEGATAMEPMKLNAQKQPTAMSMNLEVRVMHSVLLLLYALSLRLH